jgi:SAM-dependent methyltransferase
MQQCRIENLTISNASVEQIPFADATFDLITSNNCLNNVEDPRRAWQECFRVSKPGAQLVATENLPGTMTEFYECLRETLREMNLHESLAGVEEHIHAKRKPIEETRRLIGSSGYELAQERYPYFILRYVDGTAFLNHSLIRLAFLPSWKALAPETRQGRVFEQLEGKLNAVAKARGSLKMTVPFVCLDCHKAGAA